MEPIFIKKTIKTEENLPKKSGKYLIQSGFGEPGRDPYIREFDISSPAHRKFWILHIDWYLLPEPRIVELIKAQQELIDFYGKIISDNAVFLQMHHIGASLKDCNKGKELRARIAQLRKGVGI